MRNDMYVDLLAREFNEGRVSKEEVRKKLLIYLGNKNVDTLTIHGIVDVITRSAIDEKREYLARVTLDGNELKYGNIARHLTDEEVEKVYDLEVKLLKDSQKKDNSDWYKPLYETEVNSEYHIKGGERTIVNPLGEVKKAEPVSNAKEEVNNGEYHFKSDEKTNVGTKPEVKEEIPEGEYHKKVNQKEVIRENISEQKKKDIMDDVEVSEDEMDELKQNAVDFDNIANNLKPEEESSVKKVDVPKERMEKLKNSKLKFNKKKLLIEIGLFTAVTLCVSPVNAIVSTAELAALALVVRKGRFSPKTKVGKSVKALFDNIVDVYDPIEKSYESGGKSK